jgi:hypothetical protein
MPSDAVIKLRPLRIRQRCRVRFQAFPDGIEQFCLLRRRETIDLGLQIAHTLITLARFSYSGKRTYNRKQLELLALSVFQAVPGVVPTRISDWSEYGPPSEIFATANAAVAE